MKQEAQHSADADKPARRV